MRVLVVDDDRLSRRAVVELLRGRGHDVTEAPDGETALELHDARPFPLVLLDWVMPGLDGLDVCRRMRAAKDGEAPVLILMTGRTRPEHLSAALDAGANDYITKPIDELTLMTRLTIAERSVLERTRRELVEEALRGSEASFRTLIEASPDAILVHQEGRIVYTNPCALRLLGYQTPEELVGKNYLDLVDPADTAEVLKRMRECLSTDRPCTPHEIRFCAKSDRSPVLEEVSIPLIFNGGPAVVTVCRDLTERKRMERQLMFADRMVSVGTLAAGVAHEINNPMAYVLSNLRFLAEEVHELENVLPSDRMAALSDLLAQAEDGAERVRLIVRDLKTFSSDNAGEHGPVDVQRVLDGSINMAWNEIRHRAQLERNYAELPPVRASEAKLGQVFLNLLVNAAHALPEGKATENRITVATRRVEDRVEVEVTDTGEGIPEEVAHRIFDPFFTTKPVGVGTGLGLSICHSIVQAFGGDISFRSEAGKGTTFSVTLPAAEAQHPAMSTAVSFRPSDDGPTARVLVIDDEPGVARSLRRALRGHDVSIALSGQEAIDQIQAGGSYDVIFCDLMMPDMTGMDFYSEAKTLAPGLEDRIVFMTGGAFTARARRFQQDVPNVFLDKPFDIRAIQALVNERAAA